MYDWLATCDIGFVMMFPLVVILILILIHIVVVNISVIIDIVVVIDADVEVQSLGEHFLTVSQNSSDNKTLKKNRCATA